MEIRNQIVGLIRFSFATIGEFYPGFEGIDAMEAFLYDEARLRRRFQLFEALCLPSIRQQTDQDFYCLVLVGANMPQSWKQRLYQLCDDVASIRIIEAKPQHHYSGIKTAFREVPKAGATHRTTFRFDDDDALDDGFVARLKDLAPKVASLSGGQEPVAIAHNRGFFLEQREDKTIVYPTCERTPLSVGTALVAPVSFEENIYRIDHRQLPQTFDTYCDTRHYAYVRSVHQDNKSNPHRTGERLKMPNADIDQILRENFGRKLGAFRHMARG